MKNSTGAGTRIPVAAKPFPWEHDPSVCNYHNAGLSGYTGVVYERILFQCAQPAARAQIGTRGFYKAGLAELPNGDLITSPVNMLEAQIEAPFPTGFGVVGLRSWPVRLHKSADQGRTWQPIRHTPLVGKEGSLTCMADGALLLTTESLDGVGFSGDGGHTWQVTGFETPRETADQGVAAVRGPIQHPDGTLSLLRCVGTSEYVSVQNRAALPRCRAWLHHSDNGGRTWSEREEIETWDDPFPLFSEAGFLTLPDGRILACSRFETLHPIAGTQVPWPPGSVTNDHAAGHMVLLESDDGGHTWSPPRDFLNYSEVQGQLTQLADGRQLCTYTNYHLPFGVSAVLSSDLGQTWNTDAPIQLAVSNGVNTGWGTTRQLRDGTLLTVYALEPYHLDPKELGATVCHCVRWELPLP